MGFSFWHIALVAVLILLLFGRGRIPQMMGDIAEGIKSFKQGLRDDGETPQKIADKDPASPRQE